MRLCKPSFSTELPLPNDPVALGARTPGGASSVSAAASLPLATSASLTLPQSFGNIYLGETFCAYVSVCNQAAHLLNGLGLKVEVQTSSQRQLLLNNAPTGPSATLAPAGRADVIVRYELREVGIHILICSASYVDADGEARNLRKFFKFQVQNPLSMKSKSHTLSAGTPDEAVIVETQVQNATAGALHLTSVRFSPAPGLAVDDLNRLGESVDQLARLKPGDVQQYMYRLRCAPSASAAALAAAAALGRMEVHWRGPMGEGGHLQSNTVQRRQQPPRALEVTLLAVELLSDASGDAEAAETPEAAAGLAGCLAVACETPFVLRCRVTNRSEREQELSVSWAQPSPPPQQPGAAPPAVGAAAAPPPPASVPADPRGSAVPELVYTGVIGAEVGVLAPGASTELRLELVALAPGLHKLSGLVLVDRRANVSHEAGAIGEILVLSGGTADLPGGGHVSAAAAMAGDVPDAAASGAGVPRLGVAA